ncbi:MAG: 2-amino-4-hydroxy-6-hydroxymethyldihydropteridine diphosphokinase [Spirochaetales bacterium]|nr:2-amino-4-hydroxy-6-hydroxymethyldihydropteridine diphosphokinase [Spirochaetales bacterium]
MADVYIGVGSNIRPEENILKAIGLLKEKVTVKAASTFYMTQPLKRRKQHHYVNGVILIETGVEPKKLKYEILRFIEESCGRKRTADKYSSRPMDLDILLYDEMVSEEADLVIPDPDIGKRPFIGLPLFELAPRLILPDTGIPLADIAASMNGETMRPANELTAAIKKGIEK